MKVAMWTCQLRTLETSPHTPYTLQPHHTPYTLQPHHTPYTLQPHHTPYTLQPHHTPYTLQPHHTHCIHFNLTTHQCCSRVTMPRVRVQARVSSVQIRVKSKSFKKNQSRVHYSYESSPSRVHIDPHRVRVGVSIHVVTLNITVVPQLIGVLMAAAMNFHMYFTVFNSL